MICMKQAEKKTMRDADSKAKEEAELKAKKEKVTFYNQITIFISLPLSLLGRKRSKGKG